MTRKGTTTLPQSKIAGYTNRRGAGVAREAHNFEVV